MATLMHDVYIGLGSNLGNPSVQLFEAVNTIRELPQSTYIKDSGMYLSKPMQLVDDKTEQADYYNAVVLIETQLEPVQLLDYLQAIENNQGRTRSKRWAARTLDLDILLFGDLVIKSERLQIPHPGLCEREFVLYPLQNIKRELDIPGHGKLTDCVQKCPRNDLQYLGYIEEVK